MGHFKAKVQLTITLGVHYTVLVYIGLLLWSNRVMSPAPFPPQASTCLAITLLKIWILSVSVRAQYCLVLQHSPFFQECPVLIGCLPDSQPSEPNPISHCFSNSQPTDPNGEPVSVSVCLLTQKPCWGYKSIRAPFIT